MGLRQGGRGGRVLLERRGYPEYGEALDAVVRALNASGASLFRIAIYEGHVVEVYATSARGLDVGRLAEEMPKGYRALVIEGLSYAEAYGELRVTIERQMPCFMDLVWHYQGVTLFLDKQCLEERSDDPIRAVAELVKPLDPLLRHALHGQDVVVALARRPPPWPEPPEPELTSEKLTVLALLAVAIVAIATLSTLNIHRTGL